LQKEVIIKKCFEVTYFSWWEVDYPRYSPHNPNHAFAEQIYATSHSQAKYLFMLALDRDVRRPSERKELWNALKARRVRSMDWLHRIPHHIVSQLSESQLRKMKHAVGIEDEISGNYDFYRNRYVVPSDPEWDDLIAKGLALKTRALDLDYYYLSEEGKEVIISLMPIRRYHKQLAPQHAA
jgi:hypothetical protein